MKYEILERCTGEAVLTLRLPIEDMDRLIKSPLWIKLQDYVDKKPLKSIVHHCKNSRTPT